MYKNLMVQKKNINASYIFYAALEKDVIRNAKLHVRSSWINYAGT